jgi:hypothetical protein|tara:strand:+ start:4984 stop:5664 length:681 start_codon:yes stop_codon:yes gene_type:complete
MATSGTTTFNLDIDDVIEDAYERCGVETRSGYDLKSARRSLNILFQEWMNRGVHLWKVENVTANLTAGTTTYTAPSDASDLLEMTFRTVSGSNTTDTTMSKISRSEYQALPNKFSQGQPTQYYVERNLSNVVINLYQTPNTTDTQINYNYIGRIQDVGSYTNQPDAPFRFLPCMVSGLAFYLSQKKNPQMTQPLKLYYEDELQRALTEDGQRASVHIVPRSYYVGS